MNQETMNGEAGRLLPAAPCSASLLDDILYLRNEVDCRIEHGASGAGHLEYVRNCLDQIVDAHRSPNAAGEVRRNAVTSTGLLADKSKGAGQ